MRFSDDGDPDVSAKVLALHLAKVAKYPEWGRQLDSLPRLTPRTPTSPARSGP